MIDDIINKIQIECDYLDKKIQSEHAFNGSKLIAYHSFQKELCSFVLKEFRREDFSKEEIISFVFYLQMILIKVTLGISKSMPEVLDDVYKYPPLYDEGVPTGIKTRFLAPLYDDSIKSELKNDICLFLDSMFGKNKEALTEMIHEIKMPSDCFEEEWMRNWASLCKVQYLNISSNLDYTFKITASYKMMTYSVFKCIPVAYPQTWLVPWFLYKTHPVWRIALPEH